MAEKNDSAIGSKCGPYSVVRYIVSGNYGALYLGKHTKTGEEVAIKCESTEEKHPQLPLEYRFYGILKGLDRIPNILYFGACDPHYHGMVMDLLGPSLEKVFELCGRMLSLRSTTLLAIQWMEIMEQMHNRRVIYRDVKPENFLFGLNRTPKANVLHVVDFGMAKEYMDEKTRKHIEYRTDKGFLGTARYASTNAHFGRELSRRDDMESIGYILVYLCKGELPWQGLKCESILSRNKEIGEYKKLTKVEQLCRDLPQEYRLYFNHVKTLEFKQCPNYAELKNLFIDVIRNNNWSEVYDWNVRHIHNT